MVQLLSQELCLEIAAAVSAVIRTHFLRNLCTSRRRHAVWTMKVEQGAIWQIITHSFHVSTWKLSSEKELRYKSRIKSFKNVSFIPLFPL